MPTIVEIIGPAGAGKSSLADLLCARNPNAVKAERLRIRRWGHLPIFTVHTLATLPWVLSMGRCGLGFSREDIKKMIVLRGWDNVLHKQSMRADKTIVLDQGPVYRLAMLLGFGPSRLHTAAFQSWWNSMFEVWARTLHLVVWLDAPDSVLIQRIASREKDHRLKSQSSADAKAFLSTYRNSFENVISSLTARSDLRVLRCDTSQTSLETLMHRVTATLQQNAPAGDCRRDNAVASLGTRNGG